MYKDSILKLTRDSLATITGIIMAGLMGAAQAYTNGKVDEKDLLAAGIIVAGGWFLFRGNKTKVFQPKEKEMESE